MKILKKESIVEIYDSINELDTHKFKLMQAAKEMLKNSYAPYSKFRVACALELEDGTVVTGTNQENIAYPSGLCAERVAIFTAGSQFPETAPVAIAITAMAEKGGLFHPPASCGACLQVMAEYETRFNKELLIILNGEKGEVHVAQGVKTFLPFKFEADFI